MPDTPTAAERLADIQHGCALVRDSASGALIGIVASLVEQLAAVVADLLPREPAQPKTCAWCGKPATGTRARGATTYRYCGLCMEPGAPSEYDPEPAPDRTREALDFAIGALEIIAGPPVSRREGGRNAEAREAIHALVEIRELTGNHG